MLIPIEKIIVKDRIRKDFGDIQELAEDIKKNGLINPPVINKDYELLAGERRLRACKSLGWEQIPVNMMDTRDALHDLDVEISENEERKGFTKLERQEMYERRVELKKQHSPIGLNSNDIERQVAKEMGTSRTNMQREKYIVEHKDMIPDENFNAWNNGEISTHKVYNDLQITIEEQKKELDKKDRELAEKDRKIKELESREPEVKTVVKEVVPGDYREAKSKAKAYDAETRRLNKRLEDAYKERNYLQDRVAELEGATKEGLDTSNLSENVFYFCTICNNFIGNVGGLVWLTDRIADMPEKQRDMFLKASNSFRDWSLAFTQNLERRVNEYEQTAEFDSRVPVLTDKDSRRQD